MVVFSTRIPSISLNKEREGILVENGAARHTHDISVVQIASGSTLVCGFGYAPRIWAYGSGIEHCFVFGDVLRIQAWVCLRGFALASGIWFGFGCLVCAFGKALRMQECAIVLGSCSFRESREKCRSTVRPT